MSDKIKQHALEFFNFNEEYYKYLKTINNFTHISKGNINFYIGNKENEENNEKELEQLNKNLDRIYKFANNFGFIFNIYLLLSPYKKSFKKNIKLPLNTVNTNTGFTILTSSNIKIIGILRKEEYIKVIYHEIIHHIPLIHKQFKMNNINKLKSHFKILNKTIDPNEAIVEFWATIMFLRQLSIETDKDFYDLFKEELNYSLYKSYQINKLQKFNNGFWKDDETNLYCYVIFKTIIMYNLIEFSKIYTFPYNDDIITDFLIKNSNLPFENSRNNSKRKIMSLCFMVNSDS